MRYYDLHRVALVLLPSQFLLLLTSFAHSLIKICSLDTGNGAKNKMDKDFLDGDDA